MVVDGPSRVRPCITGPVEFRGIPPAREVPSLYFIVSFRALLTTAVDIVRWSIDYCRCG